MSGFKRNGSSGSGNKSSGNNGGGNRNSGGNGGGDKKYAFQRIGSLTVPKTTDDELRGMILEDLRGSDVKLNCQIYLPKGSNSVTLKQGDRIMVSFKVSDKDKDFVVGHVLSPNE